MAGTNLSRTNSSGNQRKFTLSMWIKSQNGLSSTDGGLFLAQESGTAPDVNLYYSNGAFILGNYNGSSWNARLTTQLYSFRDTNAWYHLVAVIDTANATSGDRLKMYINGTRITSFSQETQPSQNTDFAALASGTVKVGVYRNGTSYYDGSIAHYHYCDGYAYEASDFGETDSTSGIWKPKTAPSVSYGTNGFFLKFENSGAMGTDSSGNSNTCTVANGTLTQNVDTPSNNFATINPLNIVATGLTISNGNLSITGNTGDAWRSLPSTFGVSSGKYYYECKIKSFNTGLHLGIIDYSQVPNSNAYAYQYSRAYMYKDDGNKANNNSSTSYGNSFTTNDIIGVALDLDNGKIYFSKNGTYQNSGVPTSGATGTGSAFDITSGYDYTPVFSTNNTADQIEYNFGSGYFGTTAVASAGTAPSEGGIFEYDCPSGFQALCTKGINSF